MIEETRIKLIKHWDDKIENISGAIAVTVDKPLIVEQYLAQLSLAYKKRNELLNDNAFQ